MGWIAMLWQLNIYGIWPMSLSRAVYICLTYTTEQLMVKGFAQGRSSGMFGVLELELATFQLVRQYLVGTMY